tara:strand:+ start:69 stop:296 length:228 start_codon:yes stop_codon:yes gene_type:complete
MRIETHPSRSKEGSQGQISITKIKETHPSGPNAAVKALQGRIYKKKRIKSTLCHPKGGFQDRIFKKWEKKLPRAN